MASDPLIVRQPRPDLLDLFWHYGGSAIATVVLALLLAATLALAACFPQQSPGLSGSEAEVWLSTAAAGYGNLGPSLRALSVFQLLDGLWLRLLLALLTFHCLLRLAGAAAAAWHTWRRPARSLPPARLVSEPVTLFGILPDAASGAEAVLSEAGYACPGVQEVPPAYVVIYGVRRRSAVIGPVLAYLGLVALLVGLFVDGIAGWTAGDVALAPGNASTLSGAVNVQMQLESISGPDDEPTSTVLLTDTGSRAARARVGHYSPAFWGQLWLAARATGPALAVTGVDNAGRPVLLQSSDSGERAGQAAHVLFTVRQTEQVLAAPARNIAFRVVNYPALPDRGIPEPVFLVEAYRGNDLTPAVSQLVRQQASLTLDGVTYTFQPERHAVLALAYVPGMAFLALGALLALAGITVCLWWGGAQTWISLTERAGQAQALVRTAALLEGECEQAEVVQALRAGAGIGRQVAETRQAAAGNGVL